MSRIAWRQAVDLACDTPRFSGRIAARRAPSTLASSTPVLDGELVPFLANGLMGSLAGKAKSPPRVLLWRYWLEVKGIDATPVRAGHAASAQAGSRSVAVASVIKRTLWKTSVMFGESYAMGTTGSPPAATGCCYPVAATISTPSPGDALRLHVPKIPAK